MTPILAKVIWAVVTLEVRKCCLCKWKPEKVRSVWSFSKGTLIVLHDQRHRVCKLTQVKLCPRHQKPTLQPNRDQREQVETYKAFLRGQHRTMWDCFGPWVLRRTIPVSFPKTHYTGSPGEGCKSQLFSLTSKSGNSKEKTGKPQRERTRRQCCAEVKNTLLSELQFS